MNKPKEKTSELYKKAQYQVSFGTISITPKAQELITKALASGWLTRGQYVEEFEQRFAQLMGVKEAVAVSSGTDAVAIACAVLYDFGAERGDEIIVPALTFVASANAIFQAGFKPVFVDVKQETLNIDPAKIEAALTARTRAIMAVHLMGKPAAMKDILDIARRNNLYVIEDAAEAHGAEYQGQKVGTFGDMAAYSLYAAHIITSIEGGMITTNNELMAQVMRSLRNHGMENKFEFRRVGFSAKMHELEAAVGLGNLEIYENIMEQRRWNLLYLAEQFKQFEQYFIYIQEKAGEKIGPHAFSIIVKESAGFSRDEYVGFLQQRGIDSRNLFYSIPTQCAGYQFLGYHLGDFPESEYCANYGTHIGIHQDLNQEHLDYVAATTREFLKKKGYL